jgi:hypothetical protein
VADTIGPLAYTALQGLFGEPLYPPGRLKYWKSSFLGEVSDEAVEVLVDRFGAVPSPLSALFIEHLGGAVGRVDPGATAFGERSAPYSLVIPGEWTDPAESEANVRWVRDCWEAVRPYAKETVYVNYVDAGEEDRVQAAYGANYGRLAALKAKYDPSNFFRHNHNVRPTT